MKNGFVITFFTFCFIFSIAQPNYEKIEDDITGLDNSNATAANTTAFFGEAMNYALIRFTNSFSEIMKHKEEVNEIERERHQAVIKFVMIKEQYESFEKYPDSIITGWHNVIATDKFLFCKDAKVFVRDNRIERFVIDDFIPVNFIETGEIKKGKSTVTLQNFNHEHFSISEVYFVYDIEAPALAPESVKPGFVCFWTDMYSYDAIQLIFNGEKVERFITYFEKEPACFSNGMICRALKPGSYSLDALGRGTIEWHHKVEINEGMCARYRLGRAPIQPIR